ncbi:hypothetical protein F4777DRAFT_562827 [Nemania sp. FL0916]|nr:hypothetical protein F4777DRAFT_562827 [Nemania sp. FL0916]
MNKIPRKPLIKTDSATASGSYDVLDDIIDDYLEPNPALHKTASALEVKVVNQSQVTPPPLNRQESSPVLPVVPHPAESSVAAPALDSSAPVPSGSKWKSVVNEAAYFAGGLVSHPFESTKHYSILRHSGALVYYKGPSTKVTLSIFGDVALPPDRSFWIQRKGFSGNIGMAASALMRTTFNWIDVTPSVEALASSVPKGDERAWQRDIKKFTKKTSKEKRLSKHVIRETCVLRIPAAAADGYLRVVMCTGQSSKKSLCPSPTFRLASTSSDVSIFRGASLASLPLEVGLKAASVIGNQYVQRVVGPTQAAIQSQISAIQPAFMANNPDVVAMAQSTVQDQVATLEENFDAERDVTYDPFHEEGVVDVPPEIIGSDSGPERPFPIKLDGKVVRGTGQSRAVPTANLSNVAEDKLLRLNGIYIGWAAVEQSKSADTGPNEWREAIIIVGPSPYAAPTVIQRKVVRVHILYDLGEKTTFFDAKIKLLVMAFLRPNSAPTSPPSIPEDAVNIPRDRQIIIASLSREMWQPDACLQAVKLEKSQRSMTEKYVGVRSQIQRHADSFPIHLAGVRTDRGEIKDQAYGLGGFYIRR